MSDAFHQSIERERNDTPEHTAHDDPDTSRWIHRYGVLSATRTKDAQRSSPSYGGRTQARAIRGRWDPGLVVRVSGLPVAGHLIIIALMDDRASGDDGPSGKPRPASDENGWL